MKIMSFRFRKLTFICKKHAVSWSLLSDLKDKLWIDTLSALQENYKGQLLRREALSQAFVDGKLVVP